MFFFEINCIQNLANNLPNMEVTNPESCASELVMLTSVGPSKTAMAIYEL